MKNPMSNIAAVVLSLILVLVALVSGLGKSTTAFAPGEDKGTIGLAFAPGEDKGTIGLAFAPGEDKGTIGLA